MLRFASLLLFLSLATSALAQRVVSGRVVAQTTKEPLAEVTVRVAGQPGAVVTDKAGRFSLTVPAAETPLSFSHLGFQPVTVPAGQLGPEVGLAEQSYLIGEVQISYVQLQKLLLRQWRIAPASLDAAARLVTARTRAKSGDKAEVLEKNPDAVRRIMESARFDFRPDGIVKTKMMVVSHKLRWQLDEENRTLTVVDEEGGQRAIRVLELTAERMTLLSPDPNAPEITYVPAK
ncbi:carboxypeptidase-like regulatory domain-containing protein [Hymenobacter jeollabukensis]|uniref:Carboxypeptidase-like regulatory domain-containing protein n=1 Tax=Hymenobacter jeollabukensis TaxID=2025313 RepID=A0A5R8WPS6_9BACT|nr:carboxypeptidase-like regulatory domain-containing protein [Hymenobacter jeollabukensis]TLM91763.1 carboxypeptidase-like regulatory domain-containing protein [Hymenobacter jeollabukensis]